MDSLYRRLPYGNGIFGRPDTQGEGKIFSKVPDTACADCRVPGSDFRAQRIWDYPILQQPGYLCQRFNRCNICSHGYRR